MGERMTWKKVRDERLRQPEARAAYERARRAFELGETIRRERERTRLSQRELAERMGTTQSVVARLEAGAVVPTIVTLERIANALETDLLVEFRRPRRSSTTQRVAS